MSPPSVTVLLPEDSESWSAYADRIASARGEVLAVLSGRESDLISQPEIRGLFLKECAKHAKRLRLACKHPDLVTEARAKGIRVLDRTKQIRALLHDHPMLNQVLQVFSPHLWRQELTSRLQRMGLLSLPRVRIFLLVGLSLLLFGFVMFRLLPSAEVRVVPRQEPISQTTNVFLALSGATVPSPGRVRMLPLIPLKVETRMALGFDQISKEFIGTPSRGEITVKNESGEQYSFVKGTRFTNQAGMVFRTVTSVIIPAGESGTVPVTADDLDLYGQVIGERGNLPVGVKWDIPGLTPGERRLVFGENAAPFSGGSTAYKTVVKREDLELAEKRLQDQLTAEARRQVEAMVEGMTERDGQEFRLLDYPSLTRISFSGTLLPSELLGQAADSIPVEGSILFEMFAYDRGSILPILAQELQSHVQEGRRLLPSSVDRNHLDVRVIAYDDDLTWIKLTVELLGTEEYVLDPLSPNGAIFGKRLREKIVGQSYDDAMRIVKNMPEVDKVELSLWPPWSRSVPSIPSHISIVPQ